ncbi:MlaD family protein [Solitalea canadensis]|uniref:ABC-type transport system involved in resistance to organic solvents, periplasmic component n=1 Tax=Solitalea canadensis (strain ATCC 29591 / DSM 3403 / JCM 21819 / LMG 8368 / NBRC 15130 / NCIMB 12057 / USAM 9D) TaxID=929556 RepID=H8KQ18_SOLCM|nr:MlaD family protein [Solitalea canadensis]AFD06186.1 ABC-type transport system involved in resistance to organic solvents, periplasmic component [Solitalea canadensis DSM 3403]
MDNVKKIKLGFFVLLTFLLIVVAVFMIGRNQKLFSSTFYVTAFYKNIGGLQVGNNVRFSGITVGIVERIELVTDSTVRVDMQIEEKVRKFIKRDAVASIGSEGLMGDKMIVITPGKISSQPIQPGGRLISAEPMDMDKIINQIGDIAGNASQITNDLAAITGQVTKGKGSLGRLIYDDEIADDIKGTMKNVEKGTKGFEENMNALKSNFLLRGYYRKKEKETQKQKERKVDSLQKSKENDNEKNRD